MEDRDRSVLVRATIMAYSQYPVAYIIYTIRHSYLYFLVDNQPEIYYRDFRLVAELKQ